MASNSEALGIGCAVFFIVGVLLTIKPPWVADKAYVNNLPNNISNYMLTASQTWTFNNMDSSYLLMGTVRTLQCSMRFLTIASSWFFCFLSQMHPLKTPQYLAPE